MPQETTEKKDFREIRRDNMAKAREKKMLSLAERRIGTLLDQINDLQGNVTEQIDKAITKKVDEALQGLTVEEIKQEIFKVFKKLGGSDGMYTWAKQSNFARTEFYKMLVGILKANADKGGKDTKGVNVNIFPPSSKCKTDIVVSEDGQTMNIDCSEEE